MSTNNNISLKDRLAVLPKQKNGGSPLYHESLACVLKGAALHTGQDYFNWRLERIHTEWKASPSCPYGLTVGFARDAIKRCQDNPNDPSAEFLDLYYQLLIQLAVEPFTCGSSGDHQNYN